MTKIKKEHISSITDTLTYPKTLYQTKRVNRSKAIRHYCLECSGFQPKEVRLCPSVSCPLWRYRTGKEERDHLYKKSN